MKAAPQVRHIYTVTWMGALQIMVVPVTRSFVTTGAWSTCMPLSDSYRPHRIGKAGYE